MGLKYSYEQVKRVMLNKGYKFFESEKSINRIGIRTGDSLTNTFDDTYLIAVVIGGIGQVFQFDNFTTDAGYKYLKDKFLNPKGCALLVPNQYLGMHKIGLHRGKYEAFVQKSKCSVYRDINKNNVIDKNVIDTGLFGINEHHAYSHDVVGGYSAGCQVHCNESQLNVALSLAKMSMDLYGNSFTYTLLEKQDFI